MSPKRVNDFEQERKADYRFLHLQGTHLEMGQQLARAASRVMREDKPLSKAQASFARNCIDVIESYHPTLLDEYEGWAETMNLGLDSLLGTISFGLEGKPGCSSFALRREGKTIVGRNYDFFYWAKKRYLICAQPEAYYATIGMNDGLLGARHDGVNEHGLFVALQGVQTQPPKHLEPGIIFHLIPRILLETCASAQEATIMAQEMPHLGSFSYTIADPEDMFVVEAYPGCVRLREGEDWIAATSHFLHRDLAGLVHSPIIKNSRNRLNSIAAGLARKKDPWQLAKKVLTDHDTPMCGHVDGLATLWSTIMDLTDRKVTYSLGAPCRNEYKEYPWPEGAQEQAFLG
jgi:hypothetical protein